MAEKITINDDHTLNVSDNPIIPFIEGDGTGIDIWPAAKLVLDAAAGKYGRTIEWIEVLAGEKAFNETGDWLPQQTVDTFEEYLIDISLGGEEFDPSSPMKVSKLPEGIMQLMNMMQNKIQSLRCIGLDT